MAGSTSTVSAAEIAVEVELPNGVAGLVGDVAGRVKSADGDIVAEFRFESGWRLPIDYRSNDDPVPTGAARRVRVDLPEPGAYVFELDEFVFSGRPCGTCETGFGAVDVETNVSNGSIVQMPRSDEVTES